MLLKLFRKIQMSLHYSGRRSIHYHFLNYWMFPTLIYDNVALSNKVFYKPHSRLISSFINHQTIQCFHVLRYVCCTHFLLNPAFCRSLMLLFLFSYLILCHLNSWHGIRAGSSFFELCDGFSSDHIFVLLLPFIILGEISNCLVRMAMEKLDLIYVKFDGLRYAVWIFTIRLCRRERSLEPYLINPKTTSKMRCKEVQALEN